MDLWHFWGGLGVFSSRIGVFPSRGVSFSQIVFFGSGKNMSVCVNPLPQKHKVPGEPGALFLVSQKWTSCFVFFLVLRRASLGVGSIHRGRFG